MFCNFPNGSEFGPERDTECEENNIIYFVLSALGFIQFTPLKALLTLAMDRQPSRDVVASIGDNKDSFSAPGIDSIHCTSGKRERHRSNSQK